MHDVTQNLFLSLCPSLDGGNGGEEPAVWRLHPLPSEVPQVNLDVEMFHTPNAALVCTNCLNYAHTHTHSTYTAVLCPTILMDRMVSGRYMKGEEDEDWGVHGHLKDVTGLVSRLKQDWIWDQCLCFPIFVHKITVSQYLKIEKWLLSGSRHAYWI